MTDTQPEALLLADEMSKYRITDESVLQAAAELRRLHEVNQELLDALKEIVDQHGKFEHCLWAAHIARKAIAKAFALHQFMSNAYLHLNAAAQDKDHKRYSPESAEKFEKDAKDAEALLGRFQYTAPPIKPWVSLTDMEIINTANEAPFDEMVKADDYIYIIARAIEAKLKEKNT